MLGPRQQKLVDALKSGEYEKATGFLQVGNKFCCLGVATKIAEEDGIPVKKNNNGELKGCVLDHAIRDYFSFYSLDGRDISCSDPLWGINDEHDTFKEVIEAIENGNYFQEPV